ncbi:hypothetical protein PAV_1c00820 [Paenibacillus alvei DSM 29]|nr:hypothetical protein PAV_1c00820 [Paenibacillus alvei DSM 29]
MLNRVAQHSSNWCKTYDRKQKRVQEWRYGRPQGHVFLCFLYINKREGERASSIGDAELV